MPATCQDLDLHGALITHRVVFLSHPPVLITESALDILDIPDILDTLDILRLLLIFAPALILDFHGY